MKQNNEWDKYKSHATEIDQIILEITAQSIYCMFIQYIEVGTMININKIDLELNNSNTKIFVKIIMMITNGF